MAKTSGGIRTYRPGSDTYGKREAEVMAMRASGRYSSVEIGRGGGWLAVEKSPMRHKSEELEAARILADKGYKVTLLNESGRMRTPDGYIGTFSFEQRTPTKDGASTMRNALTHAKAKNAEIALIYSKGHSFTRESVEKGIIDYERLETYRFKRIIVVADRDPDMADRSADPQIATGLI